LIYEGKGGVEVLFLTIVLFIGSNQISVGGGGLGGRWSPVILPFLHIIVCSSVYCTHTKLSSETPARRTLKDSSDRFEILSNVRELNCLFSDLRQSYFVFV
jgi:hypothetical protein